MKAILPKPLFFISTLLPLLGLLASPPDTTTLIYTIFGAVLLFRHHLAAAYARLPGRPWLKFIITALMVGWLVETLAWLSNHLAGETQPALFHPLLHLDLLLASGFYVGGALAWLLAMRLFRFSLAEAFVAQGIFGVLVEQDGLVFQQGLAALPAGLLLWAYVFVVYGPCVGIPLALSEKELAHQGQRRGWLRWPLVLAGLWLLTKLSFLVGFLALDTAGVIESL
jgi:hypothetical protein